MQQFWGREEHVQLKAIHAVDTEVIRWVVREAQLEASARGLKPDTPEFDAWVLDRAEFLVRRTQPTWDDLTRAAIITDAKKSPLMKLIPGVMFSSIRSTQAQMVMLASDRMSSIPAGERTAKDYGRFAKDVATPTLVNAVFIHFIRFGTMAAIGLGMKALAEALFGRKAKTQRKKSAGEHVLGILQRTAGQWLIGGDLATLATNAAAYGVDWMKRPTALQRSRGNIVQGAVADATWGIADTVRAIKQFVESDGYQDKIRKDEKKWVGTAIRGAQRGLGAAGLLGGFGFAGIAGWVRPFVETATAPTWERGAGSALARWANAANDVAVLSAKEKLTASEQRRLKNAADRVDDLSDELALYEIESPEQATKLFEAWKRLGREGKPLPSRTKPAGRGLKTLSDFGREMSIIKQRFSQSEGAPK